MVKTIDMAGNAAGRPFICFFFFYALSYTHISRMLII